MPNFKKLNKGGAGYGSLSKDDLEFLGGAESPWKSDYSGASESGTYQSRRFDDNTGHFRGANWDDSESHGLVNKEADEAQASIRDIGELIDNQQDQPAGKWLGGGGPVSENERDPGDSTWKGSGRKSPRYAPKTGPIGNQRGHK